jgi:ankyrin repeat protein
LFLICLNKKHFKITLFSLDDDDLAAMKNFTSENFDALLQKLGGIKWTNNGKQTLLHVAADEGYYETAKALINRDFQLVNATDKFHWYPLHYAAQKGHCDILPLLLKGGADANALAKPPHDNSTTMPFISALLLATQHGHPECV